MLIELSLLAMLPLSTWSVSRSAWVDEPPLARTEPLKIARNTDSFR